MGTKNQNDVPNIDTTKIPARDLSIDPNTGNVVEPVVDVIVENGVNDNTLRIIGILNDNPDDALSVRHILFIDGRRDDATPENLLSAHYSAKTLPVLVTHGICEIVSVENPTSPGKTLRSAHYRLTEGAMDRVAKGQINRANRPTKVRTITATPMDQHLYRETQWMVDDADSLLTVIRNLAKKDGDEDPKTGPFNPVRVFRFNGETHEITSREFQVIVQTYRKELVTPEYRARRALVVAEMDIGGTIMIASKTDTKTASK
jgi:hypothetical protein